MNITNVQYKNCLITTNGLKLRGIVLQLSSITLKKIKITYKFNYLPTKTISLQTMKLAHIILKLQSFNKKALYLYDERFK